MPSVEKLILIAILVIASSKFKLYLDGRGYSFTQRLCHGLFVGMLLAFLACGFAVVYRVVNELPMIEVKDALLFAGLSLGMTLLSSLPSPKDEEPLRELLDDPENVTPAQRMKAIRDKNKQGL